MKVDRFSTIVQKCLEIISSLVQTQTEFYLKVLILLHRHTTREWIRTLVALGYGIQPPVMHANQAADKSESEELILFELKLIY